MIRGLVRRSCDPAKKNQTAQTVHKRASAIGLNPIAWSSKTLLLSFPDTPGDAKIPFNKFRKWLKKRARNNDDFRVVLTATFKNAFREYG